jgi:acetyl-CoA carboxylase biotin carboxyl carrier protein
LDKPLDSLGDDAVRDIGQLVEALEQSRFDFLQLEVGDLKLVAGKGDHFPVPVSEPPRASPAAEAATSILPSASAPAVPFAPAVHETKQDGPHAGPLAIVAPLLGRFYAQPEPGAPPFVSAGSEVTEDMTVGLIEVMKTFNAVRSGVNGTVTEICVQDAQFVEYEQILFRVRPAPPP